MEPIYLKVSGDFALFTRAENKAERVSYPIMTPSAARGILEALSWKPEIKYRVLEIQILKKPEFHSIVRNEVGSKATINSRTMKEPKPFYASDDRQLRHALMLKNVAYIIKAAIHLAPHAKDPIEKYYAIFNRRLKKGQCFHRPYLGTRECAAEFDVPSPLDKPIDWTADLGSIFYDYRYFKDGTRIPCFFDAKVRNGIMKIPEYLFNEVYA